MAKSQINARVPGDLDEQIEQYGDKHDICDAEAARQLLRRGTEEWRDTGGEPPGETLMRQATTISVVVAVVSGLLMVLPSGPTWSVATGVSGVVSTLIFGVLWLSVRVIAGRGDFW